MESQKKNYFFKKTLLLTFFSASNLFADTVVLRDSFAGNINYVTTGGTLRTANDATNACAVTTGPVNGTISGIPSGAVIEGALLYWAGSGATPDYNVTFNGTNVTADRQFTDTFSLSGTDYQYFGGVEHVDGLVTGNGTYTFNNLTVATGTPWSNSSACASGWGLVVIYSHPSEEFRTVNIFDGLQNYRGNSIVLVPKNFVAKSINGQVDGKFTVITFEGDEGNSGSLNGFNEEILLNSTTLTNAGNPTNNQFNSTINTINTNTDKYGVDIDTYDITGTITPGDTQANTRYSSGADMVLLMAEIITVSNDPVSDLSITKTHSGNFTVNTNGTYTLGVTNNGPSDSAGTITVTDTLPTGLSFVSGTGTGWTCASPTPPAVTCTWSGTLTEGQSTPNITLTVAVGNAAYPSVINSAVVAGPVFDNISANNTVTDTTTVLGPSFASSTKTVVDLNGGLALPGDVLRYTITAINSTTIPATFASVTDNIPANLSNFTVVSTPAGSTDSSTFLGTGTNGTGFLNITNFTVAGSSSASVVFDATIDSVFDGTTIPNTATVDAPGGADATPSSATTTITGYNLTTSTKTVSDINGNASYPGDVLRYTITVVNSTAGAATGVIVTDDIPANVSNFTVVSTPVGSTDASTGSGTGANGTGFLNITGVNVPGNSSVTVVFDVNIGIVAPGTIIGNTVALDGPGGVAGDTTKSSGNVTTTGFDLSTSTKTVSDQNGGEANVGDVLRYTITAINTSDSDAIGTTITDDIPALVDTFTVVSIPLGSTDSSTGSGTGANGTGFLDITNVTVPANSSVTVVFDVTIAAGGTPGDTIDNTATVATPSGTGATPNAPTQTISPSLVSSVGLKPLYVNTNGDTLGRVIPTDGTIDTITNGSTNTYLLPALATDFTVSANAGGANISTVVLRLRRNNGGTTRTVNLYLEYGSGGTWTAIGTNPTTLSPSLGTTYSTITFSPVIGSDVTIPAGQQIRIRINNNTGTGGRSVLLKSLDGGITSKINFYTNTRISVTNMLAYTAAYPGGALQTIPFAPGETAYLRSFVADPFGAADVTSATIQIKQPDGTPVGGPVAMTNIPAGATASSKLFEYAYAVPSPTPGGFWSGTVTAIEGAEVPNITDSLLDTFIVGQAIPTLLKSSSVISDPVNGVTNGSTIFAKRIPGAVIEYSILVTNTGRGPIDTGETVFTDPLPPNMMMCVSTTCSGGANPVIFTDGSPVSGLTYNYATNVTYSSAVGGGAPFTYTPVADVNGFDSNVTGVKIVPTGIMSASAGAPPNPSFTIRFRMKIR